MVGGLLQKVSAVLHYKCKAVFHFRMLSFDINAIIATIRNPNVNKSPKRIVKASTSFPQPHDKCLSTILTLRSVPTVE